MNLIILFLNLRAPHWGGNNEDVLQALPFKDFGNNTFSVSGKQKVRFPEFVRMMAEQEGKNINTEHEILAAFLALDRKRTGSVTRKQLQRLMTETGDKLTSGECK